jgi:hypothetical protein
MHSLHQGRLCCRSCEKHEPACAIPSSCHAYIARHRHNFPDRSQLDMWVLRAILYGFPCNRPIQYLSLRRTLNRSRLVGTAYIIEYGLALLIDEAGKELLGIPKHQCPGENLC